jgi:3-phosphoshikimate 1-carboxyvinyltransferase
MSRLIAHPGGPLRGRGRVPGDKSISHRALLLGALAGGASRISGFLPSGDCLATLACLRALGVHVETHDETTLTVRGRGLRGLQAPGAPLNCARSGTTMRLLAGILAGQSFDCTLTGDPQLLRRPMRRITEPLRRMGAGIEATDGHAPLAIHGRRLHGYDHTLAVASAQVKSALLLAGLYADGPTTVRQLGPARDHTERMLAAMGAAIQVSGLDVTLDPSPALRQAQGGLLRQASMVSLSNHQDAALSPFALHIPGDLSSAAFPLVAAALLPGSEVTVEGVGVNPTRTGLLDVLRAMGAGVAVEGEREQGGEPVADVTMRASGLAGVEVSGHTVVRMIDEFPVLAVAATQAHGTTVVRDAAELRVKETDRIATAVAELRMLGARIEPRPDGFIVEGPTPLRGSVVDSHGDHRLAMALAVAGLVAEGEVMIENAECVADSFPGFVGLMRSLGAEIHST